ncbi:PAAR domain-containing protein [Cupriavidus metallidurans]|uniref:PAAR domain-containing protein n=1 Tax=Cupriavidus metallidurans TaxID=119219 RepID=UPI001CCE0C35|nr:PAAR domain-containing protein [Cupriavidus metallidurans]UBM09080.1 PAAR domain-containing protein [Cupriavidus metallidurans]
MTSIAFVGDATTHGGVILTGSDTMIVMGRKAARVGDLVSCPLPGHGINPIIEGSDMLTDNGKAIALHGHRTACGCMLIALGTDATIHK